MAGIIDLFIPREKKFFECLNEQVRLLDDSVHKLHEIGKKKKINRQELEKALINIKKKSDVVDTISIEIVNFLHQTFITPIDREEIKYLSTSINRVLDSVEKIATCLFYFRVNTLDSSSVKQLAILEEAVNHLRHIFENPLLKTNKVYISKIKELENEADDIFLKALGNLFNNGHTSLEVIKQKELYEITEDAIDDTKHIAELLELVLINHS